MKQRSASSIKFFWGVLILLAAAAGVAGYLRWSGGGSATATGAAGWDADTRKKLDDAHYAAQHYITSDEVPRARIILEPLLRDYPEDALGHVLMAKVLIAEDKSAEAYNHLAESLSLDPSQDEVQFLAGVISERADRFDRAKLHYTQASMAAPKQARYPMYLGQVLMKMGDLDGAQMQLLRAKSLDASLTQVYAMLAEIAARQNKLSMAVDHMGKALDQTPATDAKFVPYTRQKAMLLRRANQPEAALRLLLDLPPRMQQEPPVVEDLASTHLMLGEPAKAAAVWVELFALDNTNAGAAAEAGLCFLRAGNAAHAQQYLDFARRLDPQHPKVAALQDAMKK